MCRTQENTQCDDIWHQCTIAHRHQSEAREKEQNCIKAVVLNFLSVYFFSPTVDIIIVEPFAITTNTM